MRSAVVRLLAEELNALEPSPGQWRADPPGALTPRLSLMDDAASTLSPVPVVNATRQFLATSPAAWDPFAAG